KTKGHEQWHELIGSGLEGYSRGGTERPSPAAEGQAERVRQQASGVLGRTLGDVRNAEMGRADRLTFEGRIQKLDVFLGSGKGPQAEHVIAGRRKDYPLSSPRKDEIAEGEADTHQTSSRTSARSAGGCSPGSSGRPTAVYPKVSAALATDSGS